MFDNLKEKLARKWIKQSFAKKVLNKGYGDAGASYRKKAFQGFTATSGSPHEDIDAHNGTLRSRARAIYMDSPIARSAISTNRTNVIGQGLQLACRIDHEALGMTSEEADVWEKNTEREFRIWAKNKFACDATGLNDFAGIQQLVFSSWLLSGDVFVVKKWFEPKHPEINPYGLKLQILEADLCRCPTDATSVSSVTSSIFNNVVRNKDNDNLIIDGVEVNWRGAPIAYWFCNAYPDETFTLNKEIKFRRVPAIGAQTGMPNVFHVMNSERPDQYRGVSYLAPVIEAILQIKRYTHSELQAAVIQSLFTVFITEGEEDYLGGNPYGEAPDADAPTRGKPSQYDVKLGSGIVQTIPNGGDVKMVATNRPNNGFPAFVEAITTQLGAALEIPREILLKQFSESYSASRAALLEAWKSFRMRRDWFVADFCQPVYEAFLAEAIALGRIKANGFFSDPQIRLAYCGAEWIGQTAGQLDPTKEVEAEIKAISEGLTTREQAAARLNGGQWDKNVQQLLRENELLAEAKRPLTEATALINGHGADAKEVGANNEPKNSTEGQNEDE